MIKVLDYSQYRAWLKCWQYWHERYVAQYVPKWQEHLRDDALCIGGLVHDGLYNYNKHGILQFTERVLDEYTPTREAVALAYQLIQGYAQRYPNEGWGIQMFEQPLMFPLPEVETIGLAKLDGYFYNPVQCEVESGLPGEHLSLTPGWWGHEYKTRGQGVDRARWMQMWTVNMQASFQMLALQAMLDGTFHDAVGGTTVQGILVSVLEKPKVYTPKRTCKNKECGEKLEMSSFLPSDDKYACPLCGHTQALAPYESKVERVPEYFRMIVTRTTRELERDLIRITAVAQMMEEVRLHGLDWPVLAPDTEECVVLIPSRECDYFRCHTYGIRTCDDVGMVKEDTLRYTGLEEV